MTARRAEFLMAALCGAALIAPLALAQETPDVLGVPDSVFAGEQRVPLSYLTTYDRGNTTTSWTQTLSWSLSRKWLSVITDASSNADRNLKTGLGRGTSGQINGQVNLKAAPRLVFSALGRFESVVPRGSLQDALQKRNRIQLRSQYELDPTATLMIRAVASSEFRRDFDQTQRDRRDSIFLPTDTLLASQLLTSGRTTARQDGASGQIQWKPAGWLLANVTGSVSRARPTSRIDSTRTATSIVDGAPARLRSQGTFEEPLTDSRAQANLGYTGARGLKVGTELRTVKSGRVYFDADLGGRERWSLSDRKGSLHIEQAPIPGLNYSIDGSIGRTFNDFANRITSTSLTHSAAAVATTTWNRSGTLLVLTFDIERSLIEGQRQRDGRLDPLRNGKTIFRFVTGNGSRRLTRRLAVDAVATASLTSSAFEKPTNDHDIARTFLSMGGNYSVSPQCSLTVHFSTNRAFNRFIDTSNSGNNDVRTDYQMLAVMNVRASGRIAITQNYLVSASYRIADDPSQDASNTLVRNRRIDTMAADTLFPFAFVRLTHNFLFQDLGPYIHEVPGQDRRYIVSTEKYAQTLEASVGIKPLTGILFLLSQKLGSTRDHTLSTGARSTQNRWNLTGGVEIDRTLPGGAALRGAVRHIGEYTEEPPECRGPNPPVSCFGFDPQRADYWVAGVTLQRDF